MHKTSERILTEHELPGAGRVERVKNAVGDRYGRTVGYLRDHDAREIAGDFGHFCRTNPVPSVLAGAAAGYLIYRLIRS